MPDPQQPLAPSRSGVWIYTSGTQSRAVWVNVATWSIPPCHLAVSVIRHYLPFGGYQQSGFDVGWAMLSSKATLN
jgi:hypothetical protein